MAFVHTILSYYRQIARLRQLFIIGHIEYLVAKRKEVAMTKKIVRAVVVGINEYQDRQLLENKLNYARADAEEIARVISMSNVLDVKMGKLQLLTNQYATQEAMWRSLNEVFPFHYNFDSDTIAIFYFAGHGMRDPIDGTRILLGCYDVDAKNPMKGGIPLSNIWDLLQKSSAGCSIAIIDACFSGALVDLKSREDGTPVEQARKAIGALQGADGKTVAIFMACRADQAAREEAERGHGVYTDELLKGWRDGKARDENGSVDVVGLAAYLNRRFAQDEQIPRSSVLSGRSVVLWQHEPLAPGVPVQSVQPLTLPPRLTGFGGRLELPMAPPAAVPPRQKSSQMSRIQPRADWTDKAQLQKASVRRLAVPVLSVVFGLVLLGLLTILIEPLRLGFLGIVFGLSILLALSSLALNRGFGVLLILTHIVLLTGFAYHYFHWGVGIVPIAGVLVFLAGLIWLFWLLFCLEMVLLIAFTLFSQMR